MKRLISAIAMIAGIGLASGAQAVPIVYPATTLVTVGSPQFTSKAGANGTFTGSFAEIGITGSDGSGGVTPGAFSYDFQFRLPASGLGSGAVATIFADSDVTAVDLTSVTFNGKIVPITGINPQSARLDNVPISTLAFNNLIIQGISGGDGSFSGTLSFRPVVSAAPEAATWAMMILGFGIVGTGLRKQRRGQSLSFA